MLFNIFDDSVISDWFDRKPALACTITDGSNWNIPMYVSMTQVIALKIILVVSPTKFIAINEPRTKQFCLIHCFLCVIYIFIHIIANGKTCNGKVFLITFKYIYDLKGYDLNEKEITTWNISFPIISIALFLTFMIELGLQLFVSITRRVRKLKRQTRKVFFRVDKIAPALKSVDNVSHVTNGQTEDELKCKSIVEEPSFPDEERPLEKQTETDQKSKISKTKTTSIVSLTPSQTSYNYTLVQERI